MSKQLPLSLALVFVLAPLVAAEPKPIAEDWDYSKAMRKVAAKFTGKEGMVIHIGDSITHATPYGQWARHGKDKTAQDRAICKWMHPGDQNEKDGWYLCAV